MKTRYVVFSIVLFGAACSNQDTIRDASLTGRLEPNIDLDICVYPEGVYPDFSMSMFQTARFGRGFFRRIKRVDALNDSAGCDLILDLNDTGGTVFSPTIAQVYSAYSKEIIFGFKAKGYYPEKKAGEAIYQAFKQGTPLYARIKAEAGQPVAAPAPAAASLPGVDQPAYHAAPRPDDFAVVVGIEKYSNDLPEARFAERDAAAVKSNLIALGVPERNIKFLTGTRATGTNLAAYLEDWLPRNVKEDSRVFFYFSGHGAPDPETGRAFLVPSDGDPSYLDKTAYPLKKLYSGLNGLKVRQVIVALDSCFSGAGGRSVLAKDSRPLVSKVDTSLEPGGKLVLFAATSAKGITTALEEQGHGIFTYYFLRGLGGEAKDSSGAVTARGLYDYLKPKVQDAASRQNRDQTPVLEGAGQDSELVRFN